MSAVRLLRFRSAAATIYGEQWVNRLAHQHGINPRTVQRWASGVNEVPEALVRRLEGDAEAVRDFEIRERLDHVVEQARVAGISEHVTAALLRELADKILPPRTGKS